ncbi:deoxyguanosinetriphosphate triphosphohydrolase [Micrococcoides hystricis]|uniref:Deoxyguanosinetriphosphate triphosphohydrolase-like protein n=1 Tax=Micrococcoides hystricis TaxID=1572761 RepID=A0ABV6PCL5_9MICC
MSTHQANTPYWVNQPALFGNPGRPPYAGAVGRPEGYSDADTQRWVPEPAKSSYRSPFERDRARILHSAALRRLGAKTQVVSPAADDFARTRLTHSLEVAQVGRSLGRSLGCDPDVVDTACLAHDLGHPPFGHNGERALDQCAAGIGGFEGNAQTLRLLTRLETKSFAEDGSSAGLNLTRASLDAAIKYPWSLESAPYRNGKQSSKFGVYADDAAVFDWVREAAPAGKVPIEGQVMDLSDDIAYSVHDVEDSIVAGEFQLGWLKTEAERAKVIDTTIAWYLPGTPAEHIDAALSRLEALACWVPNAHGSRADMAALKNMTSQLIGRFCQAAFGATRDTYGNDVLTRYSAELVIPEQTKLEIAVMKGIAAAYVMSAMGRQPIYHRQRTILTELVEFLYQNQDRYLEPLFQGDWRAAADDDARLRVVIDQVASLTDYTAHEWHATLVRGASYERRPR